MRYLPSGRDRRLVSKASADNCGSLTAAKISKRPAKWLCTRVFTSSHRWTISSSLASRTGRLTAGPSSSLSSAKASSHTVSELADSSLMKSATTSRARIKSNKAAAWAISGTLWSVKSSLANKSSSSVGSETRVRVQGRERFAGLEVFQHFVDGQADPEEDAIGALNHVHDHGLKGSSSGSLGQAGEHDTSPLRRSLA